MNQYVVTSIINIDVFLPFIMCLCLIFLSVYSPFSDRVGLPLHNIPSPFHRSQVLLLHSLTCPSWSSNRSFAFNSKLHTFLHPVLITCPYHLSLLLLMTVVIGSTPTSLLNYSYVLLSFMEIPHIHLIIYISASRSMGLVSLP